MAEEGRVRRKALAERLKAKRRAKEAELERHGAGEMERCKQDADLTRLEELQIEVHLLVTRAITMTTVLSPTAVRQEDLLGGFASKPLCSSGTSHAMPSGCLLRNWRVYVSFR